MRKEKELVTLLRSLVDLLADEADRNPDFASKLGAVLDGLPSKKLSSRGSSRNFQGTVPDVYSKWAALNETEFVLWLRELSIEVLKSIIRSNDFDPTGRGSKWKDVEKLSSFIGDSVRARAARGSAFMTKERPE